MTRQACTRALRSVVGASLARGTRASELRFALAVGSRPRARRKARSICSFGSSPASRARRSANCSAWRLTKSPLKSVSACGATLVIARRSVLLRRVAEIERFEHRHEQRPLDDRHRRCGDRSPGSAIRFPGGLLVGVGLDGGRRNRQEHGRAVHLAIQIAGGGEHRIADRFDIEPAVGEVPEELVFRIERCRISDFGFAECRSSNPQSRILNSELELCRYVSLVRISRCSFFSDQSASCMNQWASQSSSSGCVGRAPMWPKSLGVATRPSPK